jgi:hypothetical protein
LTLLTTLCKQRYSPVLLAANAGTGRAARFCLRPFLVVIVRPVRPVAIV